MKRSVGCLPHSPQAMTFQSGRMAQISQSSRDTWREKAARNSIIWRLTTKVETFLSPKEEDVCVCVCVCVCVLVTQSCPTLCGPMDCIWSGSCFHGDSPGKNTGVGCHGLLKKEDGEVKMVHLEPLGRVVGCLPWENLSRRSSGSSEHSLAGE